MINGVIFDFDGTVADTQDLSVEIYNNLAAKYGYREFSPEEVCYYKGRGWMELIKASRVPLRRVPKLLKEGQGILHEQIKTVKPQDSEFQLVISDLRDMVGVLGMVSSNTKANIDAFLSSHNVDFLDFIWTTALFSKHKKLAHAIKKYKLVPDDTIYVGDEVRDIEAANEVGLRCAAVDWGFNTEAALLEAGPAYMLHDIRELGEIVRRENESEFGL
jgi:phosphoglycolate phosphatase-like HAD superfamily hydrolase